MARPGGKTFMNVPLEMRCNIYEAVAQREEGPDLLLRQWLEKTEAAAARSNHAGGQGDGEADDGEAGGDDGDDYEEEEEDDDHQTTSHFQAEYDDDDDDEDDQDGTTVTAANGNTTATTAATTNGRPSMYRHTIGILRLSGCPPPANLLLTSKAVYREALAHYHGRAQLHIDATRSFRHATFYEEVLAKLAGAPAGPLARLRQVELVFSWHSGWVRAREDDGSNAARVDDAGAALPFVPADVWETLLQVRADATAEMLASMPALRSVVVHWHDSEATARSLELKTRVLRPLVALGEGVRVEVKEHFGEAGEVMAERVAEFEDIQQRHMDFL